MKNSPNSAALRTYSLQESWRMSKVLQKTMPRIETNARLTANIAEFMPQTLKTGWRAHLERSNLTLKVPHQALASKIKQYAPFIQDGLALYGWEITDFKIKVTYIHQPEWLLSPVQRKATPNPRSISPQSADCLRQLIHRLDAEHPMQAVLRRLLAHERDASLSLPPES